MCVWSPHLKLSTATAFPDCVEQPLPFIVLFLKNIKFGHMTRMGVYSCSPAHLAEYAAEAVNKATRRTRRTRGAWRASLEAALRRMPPSLGPMAAARQGARGTWGGAAGFGRTAAPVSQSPEREARPRSSGATERRDGWR